MHAQDAALLAEFFGDKQPPDSILARMGMYQECVKRLGRDGPMPAEIVVLFVSDWLLTQAVEPAPQPERLAWAFAPAENGHALADEQRSEPSWMARARSAQSQPRAPGDGPSGPDGEQSTAANNFENLAEHHFLDRPYQPAVAPRRLDAQTMGEVPANTPVTFIHPRRHELASGLYVGSRDGHALVRTSDEADPLAVEPAQVTLA